DPFTAEQFAAIAVPDAPLGIIRKGGDDGDAMAERGEMLAEAGSERRHGCFFGNIVDAENENAHRDLPSIRNYWKGQMLDSHNAGRFCGSSKAINRKSGLVSATSAGTSCSFAASPTTRIPACSESVEEPAPS